MRALGCEQERPTFRTHLMDRVPSTRMQGIIYSGAADQITSSMDPRLKGNICLFRVWLGISELMIVGDAGDYEAAGFTGHHGVLLFPYIMNMAFD